MMRHVGLCLVLFVTVGCTDKDDDTGEEIEATGPVLSHEQPVGPFQEEQSVTLSVTAEDEDGVVGVTLYHRVQGYSTWEVDYMDNGEGDEWSATLDGGEVKSPGLEYYFKGIDNSNYQAISFLPEGGQSEPYGLEVQVIGEMLPYLEDFEGSTSGLLTELGWSGRADGFGGYEWSLTESDSVSGTHSVFHRRGPEGLAAFKDWLVSPALDFSATPEVQVTWQEIGRYTETTTHSLWISTTNADPGAGGFVQVTALEAPAEGEWSRRPVVDLSEWGEEPVVYLAWLYEGQHADDWTIDDIAVSALAPDLHLVDFDWQPNPLDPGESGELLVTLENRSPKAAESVMVEAIVDALDATVEGPVSAGGLEAGAEITVNVPITVAADYDDDSYLNLGLEVSEGEALWTFEERMIVGQSSSATIGFQLFEPGVVTARLGVGDPESPDMSVVAFTGSYDADMLYAETIDITEYAAYLPPEASNRWWVEIESTGWGILDQFDIDAGGTLHQGQEIGFFYEADAARFYLPRPPNPTVNGSSTAPMPVSPGDTVAWTLTLNNKGAATTGQTTVTVTTVDSAVTITDPGPFEIAATGWASGAGATLNLEFTVDGTKKDSLPVVFDLLIEDEVESFERTAEVEVPFPVLVVTGVLVDDWSFGDNDGLLDPSEEAALEIYVTNVGGKSSFSTVSCTLTQTGGVATVSLSSDTASYGVLSSEETDDEDGFELEVTSGSAGDDIQFLLSCFDGTETYDLPFEIVLGVAPWQYITTVRDSGVDAIGGYSFDLLDGLYRSDGTTLDIILNSATAYDAATLFVEGWATSSGADYTYYQFVIQAGSANVRGYDGTFTALSTPTITYLDSDSVQMSIDLTTLGLNLDSLTIGFASGFCGGSDYYCDHYPDGWGDPYNSGFYTGSWVTMAW